MESAYKIDDLERLEIMANMNEFEYGQSLITVLHIRKETAKRMLRSDPVTEQELKEMQSVIDYCNNLICKVMGMPSVEKFNFISDRD